MSDELLPCPFCGGEAELMHHSEQSRLVFNTGSELSSCYIIECKKCFSRVQRGFKEDLVKAWNTRTKDAIIKELRDALNEAANELHGASECIKAFTSKVATTSGYEKFVDKYRAIANKEGK